MDSDKATDELIKKSKGSLASTPLNTIVNLRDFIPRKKKKI
jgi:hypothetical protein